jgi:hypothetical protein
MPKYTRFTRAHKPPAARTEWVCPTKSDWVDAIVAKVDREELAKEKARLEEEKQLRLASKLRRG